MDWHSEDFVDMMFHPYSEVIRSEAILAENGYCPKSPLS
jgi:hypothetical protein